MTTYLRSTVTIPHSTGLPEDSIVHTYSWIGNDAGGRNQDAISLATALDNFYETVRNNLNSNYLWTQMLVEVIDMQDARPRVPFFTSTIGVSAVVGTNNDLPPEVALCCSMRGALISGVIQARRRGRVYFGPFQMSAGDQMAPTTAFVDTLAGAFQVLALTVNPRLAVYSPYTHHAVPVGENIRDYPNEVFAQLDDAFVPVTQIWVDNEWDTQRRRGRKPTYRKQLAS